MYRTLKPGGRHDWLKEPDATPVRRPLGPSHIVKRIFATRAANRLVLKRCVALGEALTLEVREPDWHTFVEELKTLSRHIREVDDEFPMRDWDDRVIEHITDYDSVLAAALEFMAFAEQYRGRDYIVSIAA